LNIFYPNLMPTEKRKTFLPCLAILFLAGFCLLALRTDLPAAENEPVAGVAVLEGEVYYWPVLAGENPAPEYRLVALERDIKKISLLAGVDFQTQAKEILPESLPVLDKLTEILTANPDLVILITVRSEKPGKSGTDLNLSRERAEQIRDYLVSRGIEAERMAAQGLGASAGERARREEPPVEITITGQDQDLNPKWMNLKKNTDFYASDEIKTGNGKVKILFSNGAALSLRPQTYLKIIDANRVWLYRGGLQGKQESFPAGQEFITETANASVSARGASSILFFLNGVSTLITLKGEISVNRKNDPEKSLRLAQGKTIIIQNGKDPAPPGSVNPGEIKNILNEFSLKYFDSSQSLFDEEIKKRLEKIQPPAPDKSPGPRPSPVSPATFPPAVTQATTH
jgi:hypothetical protein